MSDEKACDLLCKYLEKIAADEKTHRELIAAQQAKKVKKTRKLPIDT
jgi:hypothetical protein